MPRRQVIAGVEHEIGLVVQRVYVRCDLCISGCRPLAASLEIHTLRA